MRTKYLTDLKQMALEREFHKISFYVKKLILTYAQLLLLLPQRFTYVQFSNQLYRPFQMRAWSCVTSYPLQGLPYLAYDNVNPAMVNSMMLHSSMHDLRRSISSTKIFHPSPFWGHHHSYNVSELSWGSSIVFYLTDRRTLTLVVNEVIQC